MNDVPKEQSVDPVDRLIDLGQHYEQRRFHNRVHGTFGVVVVALSEVLIRPESQQFAANVLDVTGGAIMIAAGIKGFVNRINYEDAQEELRARM